MPIKKLVLTIIKGGSRGTANANEICEMLAGNWDQVQEKFKGFNEFEKEEMLEHCNSQIESLGDALFGADATAEDLKEFVDGFEKEEEETFKKAIEKALLVEEQ